MLFSLVIMTTAPKAMGTGKLVALFPTYLLSPKPAPYLTQGLKTMFTSRLSEVGLRVVTSDTFGDLLTEDEKAGKITSKRAQEIAQKVNAQYAIFGTLTAIGKGLSLDLSLLDLTKKPPKLSHVSEATTEDEFIPRLADVANRFRAIIEGTYPPPPAERTQARGQEKGSRGPFYQLGAEGAASERQDQGLFVSTVPRTVSSEPSGRASMRMDLMAMDVDDLDGDGNPELALLSRTELRIYRKLGKTLRLMDTLKAPRGEELIKVSMGDADSDGKPEIYVAAYALDGVQTTVYEWDGKFKKLFHKHGHLCVVKSPGQKIPYLLYQNSLPVDLFSGEIYMMQYQRPGKLIRKIKLAGILHTRFYTMTPYDIDKNGSPEIIGLGEGDSLHIWSVAGKKLWNENETIGGTNNAIDLQDKRPEPNMPRVPFQSRLVLTDIDGNGKTELIAVKNRALMSGLEHFLYYDSGRLLAYRFKGASLQQSWATRKVPFCVVDIQAYNHTLFLALQKLRMKNYGKGLSRVVWFDLPKNSER